MEKPTRLGKDAQFSNMRPAKNKVVGGEIGNICVIQIVDANILNAVVDNRFSDQIASTIDAS